MHELPIMEEVLTLVVDFAKENDVKEIRKITLHIGGVSGVVPRWAGLFFKMISEGTIAENAEVEFIETPATVICRDCGKTSDIETNPAVYKCGHCQSGEVKLIAGREFRVESIEVV